MVKVSEAHQRAHDGPPVDMRFFDMLARRLAAAARLPLKTARQRVAMLAISPRPNPPSDGFHDRTGPRSH
jgi:hypothetical protein